MRREPALTSDLLNLWDEETSEPREKVPTVVDDFPLQAQIPDNEIFIIRNCESRYLTHTFHKYAGKFIPHVPRWALRRFLPRNSGAVVLDPFVGSGTTLVEALLYGQVGYGLDIDPLARLISKVKTTIIPSSRLRNLSKVIPESLAKLDRGKFIPRIPTLRHWFSEKAIDDLSAIYEVVETYHAEPDVYDLLLICFSAVIRRASNADNQTMKTYVSHTNPKKPEDARPIFLKTLETYIGRLIKLAEVISPRGKAHVLTDGDSMCIGAAWKGQGMPSLDLAITSPPYIKSVDYIYNQMAELFWIGEKWGLETQAKQNEFKKRYIGNDRPAGKQTHQPRIGIVEIDSYLSKIADRKLSAVAHRYFVSMGQHFGGMFDILKPGAHYIIVVGDSTLGGVEVPTHSLLVSCAQQYGFRSVSQFGYEIRNKHMHFPRGGRGGVVLHDWVIDLVRD